jgi:hypothetical protein
MMGGGEVRLGSVAGGTARIVLLALLDAEHNGGGEDGEEEDVGADSVLQMHAAAEIGPLGLEELLLKSFCANSCFSCATAVSSVCSCTY